MNIHLAAMKARMDEEHQCWQALADLANKEDIGGFYRRYAEYLESRQVISGQRQILLKMAKAVDFYFSRDLLEVERERQ